MNKIFTTTALSTAIALTLTACGGTEVSDGGVAGIGGSGYVSSGTVTGFGSVYVNGVKFETDSPVYDIDDSGSGSQDDLAIGMVVTVNGTVNEDGVTGTADSISYDDQLQGPVSNITAVIADPDEENRSFTILGTTVRINVLDTLFDISGTIPGTSFSFNSIKDGDHVEVSGFFNDAGELIATRLELKATSFTPGIDIVELKGTVTGFTDISAPFTLTGLTGIAIDASAAAIDDLANGLSNGVAVEVKGTCSDIACSTLNATRVEGQSGFDDADKISIEGLITDFVDNSNFKINGISVDASAATLQPTTLVLRNGARVEVEGPISNNVIQAISVDLRGGDTKAYASVNSYDTATGNFELTANAQTIAVTVTTATEIDDGPVATGKFVRVRGFENDDGGLTATRVDVRDKDDDLIVQGNLQAFTPDTSIKILGVSFTVDYNGGSGETEFENSLDQPISQTFFESSAPVGTLVKVKDKEGSSNTPPNGIADEIEIETE